MSGCGPAEGEMLMEGGCDALCNGGDDDGTVLGVTLALLPLEPAGSTLEEATDIQKINLLQVVKLSQRPTLVSYSSGRIDQNEDSIVFSST